MTIEDDPVAADWARFQALTTMANHWDRPGWSPGRQSFHWFVTFRDAEDLQALAASCQQRLRLPFLDPVPAHWLHLTVRRLAFIDEITPAQVEAAVETVASACSTTRPFTLRVGPLAGSAGAVRFTVTPWRPLTALRTVVHEAAIKTGLAAAPSRRYRPHIGIAYCNDTVPTTAVLDRVAVLRTLPPVDVNVDALELVRLRREDRQYRWETKARFPLGTPFPTGGPITA